MRKPRVLRLRAEDAPEYWRRLEDAVRQGEDPEDAHRRIVADLVGQEDLFAR